MIFVNTKRVHENGTKNVKMKMEYLTLLYLPFIYGRLFECVKS